jgi:hypothetical protein
MEYAVKIASYGMMYIPNFMKTSTGFQALLRFTSEIERLLLM